MDRWRQEYEKSVTQLGSRIEGEQISKRVQEDARNETGLKVNEARKGVRDYIIDTLLI